MLKINLDRRIGFLIHSFMVTPTHKTMTYYASGVEVNTSAVKLTTINNSLALDSLLYGRYEMDRQASCISKLHSFFHVRCLFIRLPTLKHKLKIPSINKMVETVKLRVDQLKF